MRTITSKSGRFMMPGDNPVRVRFDLERTKEANGAPGE